MSLMEIMKIELATIQDVPALLDLQSDVQTHRLRSLNVSFTRRKHILHHLAQKDFLLHKSYVEL